MTQTPGPGSDTTATQFPPLKPLPGDMQWECSCGATGFGRLNLRNHRCAEPEHNGRSSE